MEEDILKIIINDGFTSTRINSEIPKHISIRACNDLIEKGLIKREGCNRATKYVLVNNIFNSNLKCNANARNAVFVTQNVTVIGT